MSKGPRKNKGVIDKSETSDKVVTSKSGSWIDDLQAKHDAESAPVTEKPIEVVKRTRKAPKYRQTHHRGHGLVSNTVCVSRDDGKTAVKMSRTSADKLVASGLAKYAPKSLWRASNRDTVESVKPVATDPVEVRKARRASAKAKDKVKTDSE